MKNEIEDRVEKFRKDFEQDLREYAKNIAKIMAKNIADDMTEVARSAIKDFYNQYDPEDSTLHNGRVYYYRHWNFEMSYERYYKNRHPFYVGGVILHKYDLPDVYTGTRSEPEYVFNRVYAGYHGMASCQETNPIVPILKPAPMTRIMRKFNYIENHLKEYDDKATIAAQKIKYKCLDFS